MRKVNEKMVEIRYGENYETTDLAGQLVAEAREQYKLELGIPDKAQARLNGKPVKKKLEAVTELGDGDELSFTEKSRRGLFLMGAFLLALAITGGVFAYTYTTASVTLSVIGDSDFVTVALEEALEFPTRVFGNYRGDIPNGKLFKITPDADYTGDLNVGVYLANADDLTLAYKHLNMKFEIWDANDETVNVDWTNDYEEEHLHFEAQDDLFATAEATYGAAFTTFDTAETAWDNGGDVATFNAALTTYLAALDEWQSAIQSIQDATDTYVTVVGTTYYNAVSSGVVSHQTDTDTWMTADGVFDGAVTTYNTAATTWLDAVDTWRAGGLATALHTAYGTFNTADLTTFQPTVNAWQAASATFDGEVDAYIGTVSSAGHEWQLLTLDNGQIALDFTPSWGESPFYVRMAGGSFRTHGRSPLDWASGYEVEPVLYIEVTQR